MNKLVTYYEGYDPQEFIDEHMNLIVALQGFKPLIRIDKVSSNVYRFDIREVTDFAVEELNYDSDWVVTELPPRWGVAQFFRGEKIGLVKKGLHHHQAKALCNKLDERQFQVADLVDNTFVSTSFEPIQIF